MRKNRRACASQNVFVTKSLSCKEKYAFFVNVLKRKYPVMDLPYFQLDSADLPLPDDSYIRLCIVATLDDWSDSSPVATFAVKKELARQCKMLEAMLDERDLAWTSDQPEDSSDSINLPGLNAAACLSTFEYLLHCTTKVPSVISRPLRAPLAEVIQPWEMNFLLTRCLENGDVTRHQQLLAVMSVSDFLMIEPLRDLTCAFLASIALQCEDENELTRVLGMDRPLNAKDMDALYTQFPFLR